MFYQKCHFFLPKKCFTSNNQIFHKEKPMFYHNTHPGKSMALFKKHIFHFSFLSSSLKGQNKCSDFSIGRSHKFQKNHPKRPSTYGATISEKHKKINPKKGL